MSFGSKYGMLYVKYIQYVVPDRVFSKKKYNFQNFFLEIMAKKMYNICENVIMVLKRKS